MNKYSLFIFSGILLLLPAFNREAVAQRGTLQSLGAMGNQRSAPAARDTTGGRTARSRGSLFLNDSTQNVYGPATTLWTTGFELMINKPRYRSIDTSIVNYHRWTYP